MNTKDSEYYSNDKCILINGDSLEILKNFKDNSIDISLTSHPYNRRRNDKYNNKYKDTKTDIEYYDMLCTVTNELLRITRNHTFINVQKNYYNKKAIFDYIGKYSDRISGIFIWVKTNPTPASVLSITNSYEYIICFNNKVRLQSNTTYTKNVITTSAYKNPYRKIHRAVTNPIISDFFIDKFTKENNIVLDPFMGLGTTGVFCLSKHRKFVGIKLIREYYDIALNRIKDIN